MAQPAPVIILVHGLGLKEGESQEFSKWKSVLDEGATGFPGYDAAAVEMAYYSDELHPEVRVSGRRATRRGEAGAAVSSSELAAVEEQVVDALSARYWEYATDKARRRAAIDAEARSPVQPSPLARRGATRRRETTALPAVELQPGEAYRTFIRDVIKYFGLGHREPVNAKLTARLDAVPKGAPVLLVSHSLGTIVSYDVLVTGAYTVDTWVTLGSPLGYAQDLQAQLPGWINELKPEQLVQLAGAGAHVEEAVAWVAETVNDSKERIESFFKKLRRRGAPSLRRDVYALPPAQFPDRRVERWYNIHDLSDPVAAPPVIGHPALADKYLSEKRERVYDIAVHNPGSDAHSEVGYLSTLQMVWLVKDFLLRQHARASS